MTSRSALLHASDKDDLWKAMVFPRRTAGLRSKSDDRARGRYDYLDHRRCSTPACPVGGKFTLWKDRCSPEKCEKPPLNPIPVSGKTKITVQFEFIRVKRKYGAGQ